MEVVRLRCLVDPSFSCAPVGVRAPSYQYQPSQRGEHDPQQADDAAHDAGPSSCQPSSLGPFLHPNPANFAALRCHWNHPAVMGLVTAQALPGVSLVAPPAISPHAWPLQPPSLWNSMLPAMAAHHRPSSACQLQSLSSASGPRAGQAQPPPAALLQPNVCVGYQDDWLELSPAMLPLWPTVPFEPFAGQKPVQYFVLCPEDLQDQAMLFIKDVGAQYELCNLGTNHPAPQLTWLYTFSTAHPPGSPPEGPHSRCRAQRAWELLTAEQRYLLGLRGAAEQLQRTLLTSALQLRQDGPALELNLGATPVVYVVSPFGEGSGQLEEALLEAACCLAPCTPLAAGGDCTRGTRVASALTRGGMNWLWGMAEAGGGPAPGEPATPEPGADRHAGTPGGGSGGQPGAGPMETAGPAAAAAAEGGGEPKERYHGAAECLFRREEGDCERVAQREFPRGDVPPLDLTLQVVGPHCLFDLSGQAARATAFELYVKIRRRRPEDGLQSPGQPSAIEFPLVPFYSEPLFILAPPRPAPSSQEAAATQQQAQHDTSHDMPDLLTSPFSSNSPAAHGSAAPTNSSQPPRTLHCCYALPADLAACTIPRPGAPGAAAAALAGGGPVPLPNGSGTTGSTAGRYALLLVPAAWTDSCGELVHWEVLEVDVQGPSPLEQRASSSSGGGGSGQPGDSSLHALAVAALARRCVELLGALGAASHPPNSLQHIVVSRLGVMPFAERRAWERVLCDRGLLLVDVSPSHHMAVMELLPATPARLAGPSGQPCGSRLVFHPGGPQEAATATLALLPSDDPASLTLPGEHDTVQALELCFVGGTHSRGSQGSGSSTEEGLAAAKELYGLSLLNAAHFGLLWGSCTAPGGPRAGGGGGLPATAHLPLHSYLAERMLGLVCRLCRARPS